MIDRVYGFGYRMGFRESNRHLWSCVEGFVSRLGKGVFRLGIVERRHWTRREGILLVVFRLLV